MIPNNYKQSLVVSQQLPGYIRENGDYQTFITFLEAYYEFLEESGNVYDVSRNVLNYKDIDNTIDKFEEFFFNVFLQNFPKESLTDKNRLVKFSREFYQRKTTPASFKFLFRSLFNANSEIYNAKDFVLIASGGKWSRNTFLRLSTLDQNFLNTKFYKVFGETSKSVAKIENAQVVSNKTEIYISDIVRNFIPGEFVKIVDENLNNVLFDGEILRAKLVGSITAVNIHPGFEGSGYEIGDPVIFIGGTNPEKENPIKAVAEISSVGLSSIQEIEIINGSTGYRTYPNTTLTVVSQGTGANIKVVGLDATKPTLVNHLLVSDIIEPYANVVIGANTYGISSNTSANVFTKLIYAFEEIDSFETFPISSLQIVSGGSNYDANTRIVANSYFDIANTTFELGDFGILSPIKITYGGANYSKGDEILFTGGSGFGAYANVTSVNDNGSIETVEYTNKPNSTFTFGGIKYSLDNLPKLSVNSSSNNKVIYLTSTTNAISGTNKLYFVNTNNVKVGMFVSGKGIASANTFEYFQSNTRVTGVSANNIQLSQPLQETSNLNNIYTFDGTSILYVDGILGRGAEFRVYSDQIGQIKNIRVINPGEDYVTPPNVSLKIVDIALFNVDESNIPIEGDIIYQGDAINSSFKAIVDSIQIISTELIKTFRLRLYGYIGNLNAVENLYIDKTSYNSREITLQIRTSYNSPKYVNGVRYYGNGLARANAEFTSGVIQGTGKYINTDGFLSYSNFLESEIVNEYSYFAVVEEQFSKYKTILYDILHPAGKQGVNYNYNKSVENIQTEITTEINKEIDLKLITRNEVYGSLTEPSKLEIYELRKDLTDISLDAVITTNDYIHIESTNGEIFYSKVSSIDNANDIIYLEDFNTLSYENVAYGYADTSNNTIKVTSVTDTFDLINGGNYSTANKLSDIVFAGDYLNIANNSTITVDSVDYANNIIYSSNTLISSGNAFNPTLISVTRNYMSNGIFVNYNSIYKYLLGYGNTVTSITIDGFTLLDENNNVIYIPLKI
jgi:hypothetical protein